MQLASIVARGDLVSMKLVSVKPGLYKTQVFQTVRGPPISKPLTGSIAICSDQFEGVFVHYFKTVL